MARGFWTWYCQFVERRFKGMKPRPFGMSFIVLWFIFTLFCFFLFKSP